MNGFISARLFRTPANRSDHDLVINQHPKVAKLFVGKEKDRKPIDPPPIIQLKISKDVDPNQDYLQSPHYFISVSLIDENLQQNQGKDKESMRTALAGTLVSSLHRLKSTDNEDGGYFVFGDLSVKLEGPFRLQFSLYEVREKEVEFMKSVISDPFVVYASKNWPGMAESTFLTRSFSDQGVRLRLRKEPRLRLGQRGPASNDYEPRHYNKGQGQTRRESDFSQISQQESSTQQNFRSTPIANQNEFRSSFSNASLTSPESIMHQPQRKRDQSQSSVSGSTYDGSHHGDLNQSYLDEPDAKRPRPDVGQDAALHSQYGQPYTFHANQQYASRQYPDGSSFSYNQQYPAYNNPPMPALNQAPPQNPSQSTPQPRTFDDPSGGMNMYMHQNNLSQPSTMGMGRSTPSMALASMMGHQRNDTYGNEWMMHQHAGHNVNNEYSYPDMYKR